MFRAEAEREERRLSSTYQQAGIPVSDPTRFEAVHGAVAGAFSKAQIQGFLRSLDRSSVRVREFEAVLGQGLLGDSARAEYGRMTPGDQGQIREFYLHELEKVAPELRQRFYKLYAYY